MTQPAKAQEPTMEEILASIRRIIADDDTGKPPAKSGDSLPPAPTSLREASVPPRPAVVVPPPPDQGLRQAEIDEMLSSLNAASPARSLEEPPAPDVLELTESMAAPEPHALNGGFRTIDGQSDLVFEDRPPEMELARHAPAPEPDALVSAATSAAVDSAFNTLAHTVLVQNARTLEDLVREMLRPLLKNWLDDNLPGLVERLVRAEIERVSRGRG